MFHRFHPFWVFTDVLNAIRFLRFHQVHWQLNAHAANPNDASPNAAMPDFRYSRELPLRSGVTTSVSSANFFSVPGYSSVPDKDRLREDHINDADGGLPFNIIDFGG